MIKFLFVTTSYEQKANSAAIRNNAWVSGLIELGYDVTVYTVSWPKRMRSSFLMENNMAKVERTYLRDLEVLNVTRAAKGLKRSKWIITIRHLVRDVLFFPDICKSWRKRIKSVDIDNYDIILSSSDTKSSHLAAYELVRKSKKNIYWGQIWGDPWSTDINIGFTHKLRAKVLEKRLIGKADCVIYVSELTKLHMQQLYSQYASKIHYVPRGFYKRVNKITSHSINYVICYTGVLSNGRIYNTLPLIKAVEEWNMRGSIKIVIEFYGNYDLEIIDILNRFLCCQVHGNIDYEEVLMKYSVSDALLFVSNGADSTQIPGKLFDYMGTQLSIICVLDKQETQLASILAKYDRCTLLNAGSDYMRVINELIVNKGKIYDVNEAFSPTAVASKILDIVR